jgi:16S rRNA (adenine1518-N6/adenine1519-N6)-dimethyltransferase
MDVDQLKNYLRSNGLKPNFTYGQNFLIDEIVLEDIVDSASVTPKDNILEIGPGIGNLTRRLCERAGFVLSVEKDPKFLPILKSIKKQHKNFRYEIEDALQFNFQEALNERRTGSEKSVHYKVVANIPYYITGKILQMFMTAEFKPESITILTQKEVAHNVTALAGDLSILAISVQLYGEPKIIQVVPARSFFPAPKVDSAILQIKLFEKPKYNVSDEKKFFKVVKACFLGKRKQIHNTLKNNLHLTTEQVEEVLSKLKISPSARPQELKIEQWVKLSDEVNKLI